MGQFLEHVGLEPSDVVLVEPVAIMARVVEAAAVVGMGSLIFAWAVQDGRA